MLIFCFGTLRLGTSGGVSLITHPRGGGCYTFAKTTATSHQHYITSHHLPNQYWTSATHHITSHHINITSHQHHITTSLTSHHFQHHKYPTNITANINITSHQHHITSQITSMSNTSRSQYFCKKQTSSWKIKVGVSKHGRDFQRLILAHVLGPEENRGKPGILQQTF